MTNRWFNAEGHSKGPKTGKNNNKKNNFLQHRKWRIIKI